MAFEGWPGEKLIIKVWDTLLDHGVAALLRPRQILREEGARTAARRKDMLTLAQTELDIADLRAGHKRLDDRGGLILISAPPRLAIEDGSATGSSSPVPEEAATSLPILIASAQRDADLREAERAVNLSKIVVMAEEEAEGTPNDRVADDPVDPDWFARWKEGAQDVRTEDMQRLWARVLSGEAKQPRSYSLHTMHLLSRINRDDAEKIATLAGFTLGKNCVFRESMKELASEGLTYTVLLELEEMGVLNGVEGVLGGSSTTWASEKADSFLCGVRCREKGLVLTGPDPNKSFTVRSYRVTRVGHELLTLGSFKANIAYLRTVADEGRRQGFKVFLGDWIDAGGTDAEVVNLKEF